MLKHMKPMGRGNVLLKSFHVIISKFSDISAPCADHVVMVLPEMPVLIPRLAVLEGSFLGKTEPAHHFEGLLNELERKMDAVFDQKLVHLLGGNVLFRLEKHLEHLEPIFELIDVRLMEELFKMLFFFPVDRFHNSRVAYAGPGMS
jgi:hypothetical protein